MHPQAKFSSWATAVDFWLRGGSEPASQKQPACGLSNFSGTEIFIFLVYQLLRAESRDMSHTFLALRRALFCCSSLNQKSLSCGPGLWENVPIPWALLSPEGSLFTHAAIWAGLHPQCWTQSRGLAGTSTQGWCSVASTFPVSWGSFYLHIKMFLYSTEEKCSVLACFQGVKEHSVLYLWLPNKEMPQGFKL